MRSKSIHRAMVVLAVVAVAAPQLAQAAGTAAGQPIANRATVNYEVGGVPQTLIESSPAGNSTAGAGNGADTSFVVDNRVNLTVVTTDATSVTVSPASTSQVLTYTVTNTGNRTQDYALSAAASTDPFGGADNFDASNVQVFVESGVTPGYQAAEDTATFIDELAADGSATVYIVSDIPAGQVTGDTAAYALIATTHDAGAAGLGALTVETAGADTAGVDVVFGDAANADVPADTARDGEGSDRSSYQVSAAALTVTKTSAVYSDPFNGTTNPKAIPGAVITYAVTIANAAGGSTATNVTITDDLSAEIGAGRIAFRTQFDDGSPSCAAGEGIAVSGACNTNGADADSADWNATTANTVTVSGLTINAGASATIKYQVVIQ